MMFLKNTKRSGAAAKRVTNSNVNHMMQIVSMMKNGSLKLTS